MRLFVKSLVTVSKSQTKKECAEAHSFFVCTSLLYEGSVLDLLYNIQILALDIVRNCV